MKKIAGKFYQSCGTSQQKQENFGSNHDECRNEEYCCYCFKDGTYMMDLIMDQMIEHDVQLVDVFNMKFAYTKKKLLRI